MSRLFAMAIMATLPLFTAVAPALAQAPSCASMVAACPDGGGTPTGPWPFCGCKRPHSCPVRNHQFTCHGFQDSFGGETGITCTCDFVAGTPPPPPPKDFCKRMVTANGQACTEDTDGTCICD